MDYLWAGMILAGILYGTFTGRSEALTKDLLDAAGEAISLCITMAGVLSFWMGLMKVGERAGLLQKMTKGIQPLVDFLFPDIPQEHASRMHIATNLVANVLGLGWACTPAGLKAMEELAKLEEERGTEVMQSTLPVNGRKSRTPVNKRFGNRKEREKSSLHPSCEASREMCDFLILNISSLQVIPVHVIAYRMQYGSTDPARVIGPAILATCASTLAAIVYIKMKHME